MHTFISAAIVGFSCLSLISAVPVPGSSWAPTPTSYAPSSSSSCESSAMGKSMASSTAPGAPVGTVFSFPLANGFPNVQNPSSQLTAIEEQAHGTLPNSPPPPALAADDITSLKLIAFNEIFEVAFFTELLNNITNGVAGYTFSDPAYKQTIVNAITAVQAQEELHALNANEAVVHFGQAAVQPCKYVFPVSDFKSAIALAITFTDVVLGTLQDVQSILATNNDGGLIRSIGSVIGQEGEQNGFYRNILGKIPSALPFLTTSTREFAFSALNQNFVVPGSCPNLNTIDLPIFQPLAITSPPPTGAGNQTLDFSFTVTDGKTAPPSSGASLVYINQQNIPIVEPLQNVQQQGNLVTFSANFPYAQYEMNGFTIAAVALGTSFADADAVAKATIFGPALIEVN